MPLRLERFRKVAALHEEPTPFRRLAAALIAGALAVGIVQLAALLGGAGWSATWLASVALAVAAGVAAATLRRGMATAYGILAAAWLLLEGLVLLVGAVAVGLG